MNEIVIAMLSGGVAAGVISVIGTYVTNKQTHTYKQADKKDDDLQALKEAMKFLMLDRIKYLGQRYLRAGEICFEDRRLLNEMHKSYHDGLGGNGDLNVLMEQVNDLPLKV